MNDVVRQTGEACRTLPRDEPKRVTSQSLLGQHREVLIVHNGREYRLRLTQNDKLILTA
jgi:hemin uptake protein HemP